MYVKAPTLHFMLCTIMCLFINFVIFQFKVILSCIAMLTVHLTSSVQGLWLGLFLYVCATVTHIGEDNS